MNLSLFRFSAESLAILINIFILHIPEWVAEAFVTCDVAVDRRRAVGQEEHQRRCESDSHVRAASKENFVAKASQVKDENN